MEMAATASTMHFDRNSFVPIALRDATNGRIPILVMTRFKGMLFALRIVTIIQLPSVTGILSIMRLTCGTGNVAGLTA